MTPFQGGPVMIDIAGLSLSEGERERLAHPLVGGLILFARNFQSRDQLVRLVQEIRGLRPDLLIAVDHEGGRVQRFRSDGFTHLPAMRRLGAIWDGDANTGATEAMALAVAVGYVLARELVACGIDLSFTPVLDLDYGSSAVIGDRSFHPDARVVASLARSLNHGLLLAGMGNCGKHFPGHGFVAADSHVAMPIDDRSRGQILAADAKPYAWLGCALGAVMPAHVVYPAVDDRPAGFSPVWLQQILRGELHFEGAIFSDDLSMQGAQTDGGVSAAATMALQAGCDMVLVCNDPARADELLSGLAWDMPVASRVRLNRLRSLAAAGPIDLADDPLYRYSLEQLKTLTAQSTGAGRH